MAGFAELMKSYRQLTGISQRALARASGINPAIISRLESGDRTPSGAEQVLAITRALALDDLSADRLLASAGYWPRAVLSLGPGDETLLSLARLLVDERLNREEKDRFRRVLELLIEQWGASNAS